MMLLSGTTALFSQLLTSFKVFAFRLLCVSVVFFVFVCLTVLWCVFSMYPL